MRPLTTFLGVAFAGSLHSFGMQTCEFRPRGAGAFGSIKRRPGLSLEVGHDVAGDQFEALGGRLLVCPIVAEQQIATAIPTDAPSGGAEATAARPIRKNDCISSKD
jgi:hypothetical protein